MSAPPVPSVRPAGLAGCLAFILIGWSGLLVPSLIRSVKETFGQSDAGIGLVYFLYAAAYACGSLGGGLVVERLGRRAVLVAGAGLLGAGLVTFALAPSWPILLLAALPMGIGMGAIDAGVNGLFLDLFRTGRGRALNLLHVFFSLGALGAPLVVGRLVDGGVAWQAVVVGTAAATAPLAVLFALVAMPAGRRTAAAPGEDAVEPATNARLGVPIVLLAVAIGFYVASQGGVSNWLVRFLEPAPLELATTALSLFWAGLAVGRLISSRLADRFDHVRFTSLALAVMTAALLAAIVVPSLPVSIGLFALAGLASGPVYPMIVAIGGERYPERSAAVAGLLSSAAVAGTIVYPPIMGFMSVTVGLTVAMLGSVLLLLVALAALVGVGRSARSSSAAIATA